MAGPWIPAQRYARDPQSSRLPALVTRIAAGDRAAFRTLYTVLAMRIWQYSLRRLPPVDARSVTRSTFVEIWHEAGHHLDDDAQETCTWILSIAARHIDDRIRSGDGPAPYRADHDRRTHRELTTLLGSGHATLPTPPPP